MPSRCGIARGLSRIFCVGPEMGSVNIIICFNNIPETECVGGPKTALGFSDWLEGLSELGRPSSSRSWFISVRGQR